MKKAAALGLLFAAAMCAASSIHEFTMNSIKGEPVSLASYQGKILLVVNVASRCGYTPQYEGLEKLYEKYKDRGLVVMGFPANNFGGQEPGSNAEIADFCKRTYDVKFPMFSKISVVGSDKAPLYQFLTKTGGEIGWNFTKFLVGRDGKVIKRFDTEVEPQSKEVISAIESALNSK